MRAPLGDPPPIGYPLPIGYPPVIECPIAALLLDIRGLLAQPPAGARCDGCRYFVASVPVYGVPKPASPFEQGWYHYVGDREDRDARETGLCRRFPSTVGKAPADYCGEFIQRSAPPA